VAPTSNVLAYGAAGRHILLKVADDIAGGTAAAHAAGRTDCQGVAAGRYLAAGEGQCPAYRGIKRPASLRRRFY